jgi:enhancing lycopene biosynthesis protein 2
MKVAVLLAGAGVYDGSEIHESVFTLLALNQLGADVECLAPNRKQHHVVNHITGEEMQETRNVMIESARIARGAVIDIANAELEDYDALVIPGGFGAAKNLNQWALSGPDGEIFPEVKSLITSFIKAKKPICGLCMGPTVIAKALEGSEIHANLTVGSSQAASPYDIAGISQGMQSIGAKTVDKRINEIEIDSTNKIVTAPCYMMEASIAEVHDNIQQAIKATLDLV